MPKKNCYVQCENIHATKKNDAKHDAKIVSKGGDLSTKIMVWNCGRPRVSMFHISWCPTDPEKKRKKQVHNREPLP
jgi:hypothetical protein